MNFNVTAETPCNLCGDPIGKDLDAGHGLSWYTGEDGHAYHQSCADSMKLAETEGELAKWKHIAATLGWVIQEARREVEDGDLAKAHNWLMTGETEIGEAPGLQLLIDAGPDQKDFWGAVARLSPDETCHQKEEQ